LKTHNYRRLTALPGGFPSSRCIKSDRRGL
jgi:hypothetical protein